MPLVLEKDAVLAEVLAFLRSEMTTRRLWRHRAWLGRRAAFAVLERVVLGRYWASTRSNATERHAFVGSLLEALEAVGALDTLSAGRWASEQLEDATVDTRAIDDWNGEQPAPLRPRAPSATGRKPARARR